MTTCVKGTRPPAECQSNFVQVFGPLLRSGIPSDELHVYLILCDHAGPNGYCWPSDRTIGGHIGKSRFTVQRLLERLEARGLVSRTAVERTGDNQTGRVITLHHRVRPSVAPVHHPDERPGVARARQGLLHGRDRDVANGVSTPVAPALHKQYKTQKQYGPAAAEERPPAPDPNQDALLRAAWKGLTDAERAEITDAVKAENPGLARWPKLLEPLCLAGLGSRLARPALRIAHST